MLKRSYILNLYINIEILLRMVVCILDATRESFSFFYWKKG